MRIKEEEYEVVGYIQKVCVCEKCNVVMNQGQFLLTEPAKYEMICPKCGKVETVDCDTITGKWNLRKKVK
jgi:Zn finger protein HypA/HybF involved in hydrogenase expression